MAPEQHAGQPVDARADQFSFCVAIYEALYGVHPYQPDDDLPLPRAVLRGNLRETPILVPAFESRRIADRCEVERAAVDAANALRRAEAELESLRMTLVATELDRRADRLARCLRACGVPYDVRKAHPYFGYESYDFEVPVGEELGL